MARLKDTSAIIALLGVGVGAILGYGVSYLQWQNQIHYEETNLARGIYFELNSSDNEIELWAKEFKNEVLPGGLPEGLTELPTPTRSYLPNNPLYPSIKEKIPILDPSLASHLYDYYANLDEAENLRIWLRKDVQVYAKDDPFLLIQSWRDDVHGDMRNRIIHCSELLPVIKQEIIQSYGL
jgi:hypothetical protein